MRIVLRRSPGQEWICQLYRPEVQATVDQELLDGQNHHLGPVGQSKLRQKISIFQVICEKNETMNVYYRVMTLVTVIAFGFITKGQDYDLTEEQIEIVFDRALRQQDGRELRRVLHPDEVNGVTDQMCTKFLTTFVSPWFKGPSLQVKNGVRVTWNSANCDLEIGFRSEGGITYKAVNEREFIFRTPVIHVNGSAKSDVGFADILFGIATERSVNEKTSLAKMKMAQKLVEGYIATTKKIGIKGSVDSDTGKWTSWETIIAESRAEVKKAESGI